MHKKKLHHHCTKYSFPRMHHTKIKSADLACCCDWYLSTKEKGRIPVMVCKVPLLFPLFLSPLWIWIRDSFLLWHKLLQEQRLTLLTHMWIAARLQLTPLRGALISPGSAPLHPPLVICCHHEHCLHKALHVIDIMSKDRKIYPSQIKIS